LCCDSGVQAEPSHFRDLSKTIILFPSRDGLQREHYTSLLRPDGDAVTDRTAHYLLHRLLKVLFQVQVAVLLISLKDSFAFQKPGNRVVDGMHQSHQFLLIRCVGTMKSAFAPRRGDVNTVQKQHMEMYVQIERTAEALD
jgi:hypothetical protein